MSNIGQKEILTQKHAIEFFKNQLGYDYLDDWKDRENNSNIEHGYRLTVIEEDSPAQIAIRNGRTLEMRVGPGTEDEKRRKVLQRWYRQLLRDQYILVHEMVHLLERHHNDRFRAYMDAFLPTWRSHRDELNRAPLAHEEWEY